VEECMEEGGEEEDCEEEVAVGEPAAGLLDAAPVRRSQRLRARSSALIID
jgi:hypothetical protein